MRLNTEFFKDAIDIIDEVIREVGYRNPVEFELPNGIRIRLYNQYPHYYRFEIIDRYRRDIKPLIIIEDEEGGKNNAIQNDKN